MFHSRKHHTFGGAITLLAVWTFSSACTSWHTTSLQPQRFSAEKSPEEVHLTLTNGTEMIARHPVMVGDSLIWMEAWRSEPPAHSDRNAIPISNIQKAKVHGFDPLRTVGLVALVGGGIYYVVHGIQVWLRNLTFE